MTIVLIRCQEEPQTGTQTQTRMWSKKAGRRPALTKTREAWDDNSFSGIKHSRKNMTWASGHQTFQLATFKQKLKRKISVYDNPLIWDLVGVFLVASDRYTDTDTHLIKKELAEGQLQQRQKKHEMTTGSHIPRTTWCGPSGNQTFQCSTFKQKLKQNMISVW